MPVPTAAEISTYADLSGVPGEHAQRMALQLAEPIAAELDFFASTNQVLPGVPVAVSPPPAMAGATVGPGPITGIVNPKPVIQQNVVSATGVIGLDPIPKQTLDSMLTEALVQGLDALKTATMRPGVPIAGGVTTGVGGLMAPMVTSLESLLPINLAKLNPQSHIPAAPVHPGSPAVGSASVGVCLPTNPAESIGKLVASAMNLFVTRIQVLPGIPAQGGATLGPGLLT